MNVEKFFLVLEKIVRIVIGIYILYLGYNYQTLWSLIGIIPLITGLIGCPVCWIQNLNHKTFIANINNHKEKDYGKKCRYN